MRGRVERLLAIEDALALCCIVDARKSLLIFSACAALLYGGGALAQKLDRPVSAPYRGDLAIFEDPQRDEKLQVGRVMDLLGLRSGSRVADVGAGSGWFTVRSARRVGERGVVYAVEINADYVRHIEKRATSEHLGNIRTILGKPDDPLLPRSSVDAVLLLKTYHEIAEPLAVLRHIREAMRPNGRLGIIDRNGKGDDHGLDEAVVVKEAAQAGFTLVARHDFVKGEGMDYFLIFGAAEATAR